MLWKKASFVALIIFILSPLGSPQLALALGLAMALSTGSPYPKASGKPARLLLQASVVLLGFGMDLTAVFEAGRRGILFTIATIFGTLALGWAVGRILAVASRTSSLISAGTAICGGSAIAAVAPAIGAESEEISVSLGTVFVLNAVGLYLFPLLGAALGLTGEQFGIWSAVAIHDTSSVVGAAAAYGEEALAVATPVKLSRALWIAPVALLFALAYRDRKNAGEDPGRAKLPVPWFIFLFLLAAAVRSYAPAYIFPSLFDSLVNLAKAGMTVTLFLIGASLSRQTIRAVGIRPLVQGIVLWVAISAVSLAAVLTLT